MKRFKFTNGQRRAAQALFCAAMLLALGCDSDVSFSPTTPQYPGPGAVGPRNLQISGSLIALEGGCIEAVVLYDGQELAGTRVECRDPDGCTKLDLSAVIESEAGRHIVSFQVLSQSSRRIDYEASGTALVSRGGIGLGGVAMQLGPKRARLRAGGSIDFDIAFQDWSSATSN